jgi:hypothetical protein
MLPLAWCQDEQAATEISRFLDDQDGAVELPYDILAHIRPVKFVYRESALH